MIEPLYTRCYLESLTTAELAVLADQSGIDLPRNLERVFIIEELLELEPDEEGAEETPEPEPLAEAAIQEQALLPEHYNITFIEILIRDPLWVFAFWEIKEQDKDVFEGDQSFGGYFLRAVPLDSSAAPVHGATAFTIPVGPRDDAWYVNFPLGGRFKLELIVSLRNTETLLAVSRPFMLAKPLPPNDQIQAPELVVLSGIGELPVLRNTDRLSRLLHTNH